MSAMRTHAAFENNFALILDKHATKNFQKQIMIRSRLKNKANKSKNPSHIVKFKWQQNK